MKKLIIAVSVVVFLTGCDFLMPQVEKSRTEKKQYEALIKQNEILTRIAIAVESLGDEEL